MRTSTIDADLVGYGGGPSGAAPERSPQKIFVGTLLVVIGMLFVLITVAYLGRSQFGDWRALADSAEPLSNPWRLWINTGLLALGSVALHWARKAQADGRADAMRLGLAAAGVFSAAFLAGQLTVWNELVAGGHLVDRNPANSFFYLITGLHGRAPRDRPARAGDRGRAGLAPGRRSGAARRCSCAPGTGISCSCCGWRCSPCVASSGESLDAFAALCGMR